MPTFTSLEGTPADKGEGVEAEEHYLVIKTNSWLARSLRKGRPYLKKTPCSARDAKKGAALALRQAWSRQRNCL